ncbi:ketoacyl-ACP synthase III [Chitinophagaceae bacterium LB-8]|uniref:Ketoacyl-ACP synthase III n=1 Tax=Paraflavisolibacter caeni TaxID=2982496 RepID=A0A9X2XNJ8_9BACT|nr:ketoacyl-ACP synthase III [Paraflavisolibacter caeni]MCU7548938.1 ketoacyl-ACP synthase III [Paraflavisolibacter caeni]
MLRSVITGTGCYIPSHTKTNEDFIAQNFYAEDNTLIGIKSNIIIDKFKKITGIEERRYVTDDLNTSDIATLAARDAIKDSGIDMETLDLIIVAHNFGNVLKNSIQTDVVPSLANRVKHNLKISNPRCVAFDVLFGCPGWVQGVIQADAFFKAGMAKKALIIGAETLSRVIDVFDRDSMIFSDGAGATVIEYKDVEENGSGILSSCALSHCIDETYYLSMHPSNNPEVDANTRFIKMKGRKVYEYALKHVPEAMKECLDNSGVDIRDLKKIFIHQANEKMDEAIVQSMYRLYGYNEAPNDIMPMCIHYLGNSSVATIPTLYDIVLKGKDDDHSVDQGNVVLFASVGAGMNINAICYRI